MATSVSNDEAVLMINVGIIGGTGYTGGELARLLCRHPQMNIVSMTSRRHPGVKVQKGHPFLEGFIDLRFTETVSDDCELVFVATPYGASMDITPQLLDRGMKVVDLSGDYRLHDVRTYKQWYGIDHRDQEHLPDSVYGIPELFRDQIKGADLVANPGCYPTCTLLTVAPLYKKGLVEADLIVDAKSGTSGAGMEPTPLCHHPNCSDSVIAYKVGKHRHTPEMEMVINTMANTDSKVVFTPHLVPLIRGILSTCYAKLKEPVGYEEMSSIYEDFYRGERFVRVTPNPSMRSVVGSNFCEVGFAFASDTTVVSIGAVDNLVKGASGQAIQNANLMLGLEESMGIDFPGLGV
jgi:N-acetyl-gamma-glutamyl-phosphate reductase